MIRITLTRLEGGRVSIELTIAGILLLKRSLHIPQTEGWKETLTVEEE